tara:strand:- start:266 stop:964 length:699 start_codon:yes stop_codon:yes gene_type:complete
MAKKKLLSEAQVRRFMGLAGIQPLNEMGSYNYKRDDEEKVDDKEKVDEAGLHYKQEDEVVMEEDDPMAEEEADLPDEEPMDDIEPIDDSEVSMEEEDIEAIGDALETLKSKLSPLLGQAGASMDMEMEDEPMDDMEMEDEPMDDMDMEDEDMEDEDMDAELAEVNYQLSEEEIVNEVSRRVAKRIVEAKRAQKKMNEALGRNRPASKRPNKAPAAKRTPKGPTKKTSRRTKK